MDAKPWYTSKTVWANVIVVVVAILAYLGAQPNLLPAEFAPWVLAGVGVLNIVLRFLTGAPLAGKKAPSTDVTNG